MATVRSALADAGQRLVAAGVADGAREADWLLAHVLDCSVGALRLQANGPLSREAAEAFSALVERRARREPIQYILGTEEFAGLTFRVTPAVLIPRYDTEVLVEQAVARLAGRGPVRVADIGTGSGAIAVAVAHRLPEAHVVAVDLSAEALAVAQQNAAANGVAQRVTFRQGDLLHPLGGEVFDAILSNPPYIDAAEVGTLMPEVRDWEPHLALSPGADGLALYRRLAAQGPVLLAPGGFLAVEVGAGQAPAVADLMRQVGLEVATYPDTAGILRVVCGGMLIPRGESAERAGDQPARREPSLD